MPPEFCAQMYKNEFLKQEEFLFWLREIFILVQSQFQKTTTHLFPIGTDKFYLYYIMNDPDKSRFFADLRELIVDYLQQRLELTRALAFEKIARIVAYLVIGFVLALLFFFGLLFLSFLLGFYLSELLHSQVAGFAIVAGIYFLAFALLLLLRERVFARGIMNSIIRILYERQVDEDEEA